MPVCCYQHCSVWTFISLSITQTSNFLHSLTTFGLLLAFPQLQGPIHHFPSLRLDFFPLSDHFKVQSATLLHFVWTSACLYSASRSNPPHFSAPFGLSPCLTPLPSPFRHTYIRTEREARPCCCIYQ